MDQKAAGGVVAGAVVGGVLGAIVGNSSTAARGAGVGAMTGGVGGAGSTHQERQLVVKNCLRNRGYKVLNQPWLIEMTREPSLPGARLPDLVNIWGQTS